MAEGRVLGNAFSLSCALLLLVAFDAHSECSPAPAPITGGGDSNGALDLGDLTVPLSRIPPLNLKDSFSDYCDTTGWTTVSYDGTTDWPTFETTLSAGGKFVDFAAGTYVDQEIVPTRSDTLLRGNPLDHTAVTLSGSIDNIKFGQGEVGAVAATVQFWKNTPDHRSNSVTHTGLVAGASTVGVSSVAGYSVGDSIRINAPLPTGDGNACQAGTGFAYSTVITDINGLTLSLRSRIPEVMGAGTVELLDNVDCVGLEHMVITRADTLTRPTEGAYNIYVANASNVWLNDIELTGVIARGIVVSPEAAEGTLFGSNINEPNIFNPAQICQITPSAQGCLQPPPFACTNEASIEHRGNSNWSVINNRLESSQAHEMTGWNFNVVDFANLYAAASPNHCGGERPRVFMHGFGCVAGYLGQYADMRGDGELYRGDRGSGTSAWKRNVLYASRGAGTNGSYRAEGFGAGDPIAVDMTFLLVSGDSMDDFVGGPIDSQYAGSTWIEYAWMRTLLGQPMAQAASVLLNGTVAALPPVWPGTFPATLFDVGGGVEPHWWSGGTVVWGDPAAFVLDTAPLTQLPAELKWGL